MTAAPLARARDSVLLATGLSVLAQYTTSTDAGTLKDAWRKIDLDPDDFLGSLDTSLDALYLALGQRRPLFSDVGEAHAEVAETRSDVHEALDHLQDMLVMAMDAGEEGSENYPSRFKFNAEDGLGAVAAAKLLIELVKDLETLVPKLKRYGITQARVDGWKELGLAVRDGKLVVHGATGTLRAADHVVFAARDALKRDLRLVRTAHKRATRNAKLAIPLDVSPLQAAYGHRKPVDETT